MASCHDTPGCEMAVVNFAKSLQAEYNIFLKVFRLLFHCLEYLAALSDFHVSSGRLLISGSMDVVPHSFHPRSLGRFLRSLTRSQNSQSGLGVFLLSLFIALPWSRTRCWRMSFFGQCFPSWHQGYKSGRVICRLRGLLTLD